MGRKPLYSTKEERVSAWSRFERDRYWKNVEESRAKGRKKWKIRQELGLVGYDPENKKYQARMALRNAVKAGRVVKPRKCESCGHAVPRHRLHGHHEDYSKPLEVKWECSRCHGSRSRKERGKCLMT